MPFFEAALATLADVPVGNARVLVHDAGPHGLVSICRRASLPSRLFRTVKIAVDTLREVPSDGAEHDHERHRARVIARILTQCDDVPAEDLDYMLGKLEDALAAA